MRRIARACLVALLVMSSVTSQDSHRHPPLSLALTIGTSAAAGRSRGGGSSSKLSTTTVTSTVADDQDDYDDEGTVQSAIYDHSHFHFDFSRNYSKFKYIFGLNFTYH
jgi:hypothetical protein